MHIDFSKASNTVRDSSRKMRVINNRSTQGDVKIRKLGVFILKW